ncbi:MAG: hypothetical protein ACKO83_08100, partial [Roseiflexaceae bacterium]
MSDTNTNAPHDQQGASSSATGANVSLVNELRAFGTQIEAVARAFLASNQAQQIQQELQRGVGELVDRLQTVRSDERVVEATEKGKQAVERAMANPA